MPALEKFMCCAQLRTGAVIIGWVGLTLDVICLAANSAILANLSGFPFGGIVLRVPLAITLAIIIISSLVNILLLWAIKREDRLLLVPWLTVTMVIIVFMFLELFIFCMFVAHYGLSKGTVVGVFMLKILFAGSFFYTWICILSYFQELLKDSSLKKEDSVSELSA